jgi:hypothetical protein
VDHSKGGDRTGDKGRKHLGAVSGLADVRANAGTKPAGLSWDVRA